MGREKIENVFTPYIRVYLLKIIFITKLLT